MSRNRSLRVRWTSYITYSYHDPAKNSLQGWYAFLVYPDKSLALQHIPTLNGSPGPALVVAKRCYASNILVDWSSKQHFYVRALFSSWIWAASRGYDP